MDKDNSQLPRILITPGEPAGIGPDITLEIADHAWQAELVVIADPALLQDRAKQLGKSIELIECNLDAPPRLHKKGQLSILPIKLSKPVQAGKLDPANADYVLQTLNLAADLCVKQRANAIVTGPVHKGIINDAGIPFTGHTEFFAQFCQVAQTVMLFVVDELRVALVTTHLPLANVSAAITPERLHTILDILIAELKQRFQLSAPRILVCGLNPHAGEGGYLGREEIDIITPVLNHYREQGNNLVGPLPADTIFTPPFLQAADAILSMYHDQALPVVKYLGFGHAVNMTLGLPFLRTSVDHGTAIDIAGTKHADAGSMKAAINLAIEIVNR